MSAESCGVRHVNRGGLTVMSTTTRLTIEQYDQMIADGAFESPLKRDRVELIDGEIRTMSPIGPPHEDVVLLLSEWSFDVLPKGSGRIRIQLSVGLPSLMSAPQPDVAWVRHRSYSRKRPAAEEVLLIIEVADSSLRYDRGEKAEMYAAAGIADYWVVDIPHRAVHVYRNPQSGKFASCATFRDGDKISPLKFPSAELIVESLFLPDSEDDMEVEP